MPNETSMAAETMKRRNAFMAIASYAKPYRLTFLMIFICILFSLAADVLQPYLVKIAIDDDLSNHRHDLKLLYTVAGSYLALSVVSFCFTYLQNNLLQFAGQRIIAKLRNDIFRHITQMSMAFFDRNSIGGLVTNISSDTETISQFFTQVFLSLMRDGMTLLFIIIMMFQLSSTLAFYSLLVLPVIAVIAISFRVALRKAYQNSRSHLSRLVAFTAENLAGMSITQVFHQEQQQFKYFAEHNDRYFAANRREIRINVLFNRSFDLLGNLAVAFMTWLGGVLVFKHMIPFGVVYASINYIRQFFQPINQITQQWNTFQSTIVSMERIWRILETEPEIKDPPPARIVSIDKQTIRGEIEFNHVRFGYSPDIDVIHDFQLHVKAGQMIGIVGTTGAGKSSIISLLNRFYDVKSGEILIDGINIRHLTQKNLHQMIGLVQQEPFLFSGTIVDNVRLFNPDISAETVIDACKFVGADAFIQRLPEGYDTRLSERGSGLSAGERQLLSFARIVVYQPKILVLDEATANLDSQTEQLVQRALQVVAQGRTTLVIAHRLSTIMHADRIIVMRHGRIAEQGTHQELFEKNGYYADLYKQSAIQPLKACQSMV